MPRKQKSRVEIVPRSEAVLVSQRPTSPNLQAAFDRMVLERMTEMMAARGAGQLNPDFQTRESSYEIQRQQTVFERQKGRLYFEKWGCKRCDRKNVSHASNGFCARCQRIIWQRLAQIKIEFDRANPEEEIERQIDHLTSRLRNAREV
jgi:hypothetical protein